MIGGSFSVGQRLTLKNQPHRVFRDLGDGLICLEELSTGRISEQSIAGLLVAWKAGDVILGNGSVTPADALRQAIASAHVDAFRQSYTEGEQYLAKARLVFVERLEKLPRTFQIMTPIILEIWTDKHLWKSGNPIKNPPHFTTVLNWIRAYQASSRDIRCLVNRHEQKGNVSRRHHPDVCTLIEDLIKTRYLIEERPTLKAVWREANGIIAQRNATRLKSDQLRSPSYGYVKARVQDLAPYDVYRARYGQRVADIRFRVAGKGATAARPLARAAMDHNRMDVFVVDDRTGLPLGRPWLTIVLDENCRYVLGYYLGFEEPSNVSMTRALRHAMAPKDTNPNVECSWDAWGEIETLVVDNGLEFHAKALEAGAGCHGTHVQFCPRRKPWYKGKIERFFGTMNTGLLVDMKGKTFSSILFKGDYDPATHAVMTLATLRNVVHMWIVDVYHQERHSGLGMTPAEAWSEGIQEVDRYLPPSSLAMESAFSASCRRELTHKGIEFDSLIYNSWELGALRELHGSQLSVEVRSCDDDLGHVIVVAPDQKVLLKIPALDLEYAVGLTRWQHKVCKRFQRRLRQDEAREISLLGARQRIRALIEEDMQLASRKSRKAQQRFIEKGVPNAAAFPSNHNAACRSDDEPVSKVSAEEPVDALTAAALGPQQRQPRPASPANTAAPESIVAQNTTNAADNLPTFPSRKIKRGAAR